MRRRRFIEIPERTNSGGMGMGMMDVERLQASIRRSLMIYLRNRAEQLHFEKKSKAMHAASIGVFSFFTGLWHGVTLRCLFDGVE
jgi:hypothetical protein